MDRRRRGFSLPEMLLALVVLSLLLALAVPPLGALVARNRAQTSAHMLMTSLFLARTQAIKRNQRTALCKSADGAACTLDGDWAQGWLVFVDPAGFGTYDPGETLLAVQGELPGGFSVRNTNAGDWYAYRPDGSAASSGGLVTGTFRVCPRSGEADLAYRVITNVTGRPRLAAGIGDLSCP